jgi:hypothetical protein
LSCDRSRFAASSPGDSAGGESITGGEATVTTTEHTHDEKLVMAALATALEAMDAALGKPYDAQPLRNRVLAWLPACRDLPPDAVRWAAEVVCAKYEKYPVPAQFVRLARGSPAWQARLDAARRPGPERPPETLRCEACGEPRAWHRVRPFAGAPRPMAIRGVRHRPECPDAIEEPYPGWWEDQPSYGQLALDEEAWRAAGVDWERGPGLPRGGDPTRLDGATLGATDADRAARAERYRDAARGARDG